MLSESGQVHIDITAVVLSVVTIIGTIVALTVWLVKWSEKRTGAVTDRYFAYLEKRAEQDQKIHDRYATTIEGLMRSVEAQTSEFKVFAGKFGGCPAMDPHNHKVRSPSDG